MMTKTLYIAFKGKNNSSFRLVNCLKGEKMFLTNSFAGVQRDIDAWNSDYEKIIIFGLDKNLHESIRFEQAAMGTGQIVYTSFDMEVYVKQAENMGVDYCISRKPTNYLCNEAYFCMMKKATCPVLLVHIPGNSNMTDEFFEKLVEMFEE